jgi:VWFA-related protein
MKNRSVVRTRLRPLALVICLLAPGWFGCAQTAANPSEISAHDETTTFTARINLVMVPVVVRDRQGHPIGTLRKEDFQLFDRGKPQVISKFSVEKPSERAGAPIQIQASHEDDGADKTSPPPTLAVPTRFIAYIFDDVHLEFADLAQARSAAARHLAESMQPTDRVAIYTTSGQNNLDFTDDLEKLREALLRIQPRGKTIRGADCPEVTYYVADLIQNKNDPEAFNVATQDALVCANLDPTNANDQVVAKQLARSSAARTVALGDSETHLALIALKDVVRRMSAAPGQRAIVLVSPGFFLTNIFRPDETDLMDRAIRANVAISALDARGLYATLPGGDISTTFHNQLTAGRKDLYQREGDTAASDVMAELAEGTGGTFFHNSNDLLQGFQRVAAAPEFIYLLGFSPQNLKLDGTYHALKVTLKNTSDVSSQARRGYYAPKHEIDAAQLAKEEIREAVFSREEMLDIPLELQTQFFKSTDVNARLAVLAKVDVKHLRFRKADGRNNNGLTVVSGLFDRNGNLITALEKLVELRLKDETVENRLGSGMTLKFNFDITPGSYVIRVVVRDREGQLMAARNSVVEIP